MLLSASSNRFSGFRSTIVGRCSLYGCSHRIWGPEEKESAANATVALTGTAIVMATAADNEVIKLKHSN